MNHFSTFFKQKSLQELDDYIVRYQLYQPSAVIAAIEELRERGSTSPAYERLKSEMEQLVQDDHEKRNVVSINRNLDDMPPAIMNAGNLLYLSGIIAVLGFIGITVAGFADESVLKGLLGLVLTVLFLFYLGKEIRDGKSYPRFVLIPMVLLSLIFGLGQLLFAFEVHFFLGMVNAVQQLIPIFAMYLLFKEDSTTWYQREN